MVDQRPLSELCSIWYVVVSCIFHYEYLFIVQSKPCYLWVRNYNSRFRSHSSTKAANYRCPRCSTRTCSLPCYKRHQTWAQCSGKRDPTAYIKKGQLATPAGIDHDYNFLTGIERELDAADQHVSERGNHPSLGRQQRTGRGGAFDQAILNAQVIIDAAPHGMSRQRENRTRWLKKYRPISCPRA